MSAVQEITEPVAARPACSAAAGSTALPASQAIADAERASAAVNPDARLIELGRQYSDLHADYLAASRQSGRAHDAAKNSPSCSAPAEDAEYIAAAEIEDALYAQVGDLEVAIMAMPAQTLDGLRVKALVAHNNREPEDRQDFSERAAFAVVDFVLALGAGHDQAITPAVAEAALPVLPQLSLDGLEGRHLDILFDLFLAIENIAMGVLNQPRCAQVGSDEALYNLGGEIVDHVHEWATASRDMIGKYAETSVALDANDAENRRWVAIKNLAHYQCTLSEVVIAAAKLGPIQKREGAK